MLRSVASVSETQPAPGQSVESTGRIYAIAALGGLLAVIILVGLTIPTSIFAVNTPVHWTAPIAEMFGQNLMGLLRFIAIYSALWLTYAVAVWVTPLKASPRTRNLVVAISLVLVALATVTYPGGSRDIWHNIADGRLIVIHGQNPLVVTPYVYSRVDPIMESMSAWNFLPGPTYYGPFWYVLTAALSFVAGDGLATNLIAFKAIEALFLIASIPLVYRLAERIRTGTGVAAIVAFAWNPLVLWAGPLDGHNDIVMVFFVLASLHEMTAKRFETAIPLLFLGALTKYTALLVLPVIAIHGFRSMGLRSFPPLAFGLAGGLALTFALWVPFWEGPQTLHVLRENASGAVNSPVAALLFMLSVDRPSILAVPAPFSAIFTVGFLAVSALLLLRYWRLPGDEPRAAFRMVLAIMSVYLYLGLWWFWPQYITWLLPLGVILGSRASRVFVIVFSASAMTVVMFHGWWWTLVGPDQAGYNYAVASTAFLPPVLVLALHRMAAVRHRSPLMAGG